MNNVNAASVQQIAKSFGCTLQQLEKQYRTGAAQLRQLQARAEQTGRKVGKYTAAELAIRAELQEARANECTAAV
jgi:transposase-like protein